ncbi:MAG TPA: TldD/PmbA family protein [Candidatus Saccharimonadales bacterium]
MSNHHLTDDFLRLPYEKLAELALTEARRLGASYADFRFERLRRQSIRLRDAHAETNIEDVEIGYCVRLLIDGAWGFAGSSDLDPAAVKATIKRAERVANASRPLLKERVELAPEPTYVDTFISDYDINPFSISLKDKIEHLSTLADIAQQADNIDHTSFDVDQVLENKFYANLEGSAITQQRIRVQGNLQATSIDRQTGRFESIRTNAAPAGRGWERFVSQYDYAGEISQLPSLLAAKHKAQSITPGRYDLVIDPTNLFLTIHESVGHATELDRALGYEANYAGTSFATIDNLDKLQYGSAAMTVTGDRTTPNGLATIGYDDEGVKAQKWDIIKIGRLVGYQLNRQMAPKLGLKQSNGCAFSDSFVHAPLQRMPNVSLAANTKDVTTDDLIAGVDNGIYIIGDNSWSIDMQRYNFQFTGQQFYRIKNGRLDGQLKDVAYQANTLEFWNSLVEVGGMSTYVLGGAFNCGKGQPGQVAPVSHGSPAALFKQINVLNTVAEANAA